MFALSDMMCPEMLIVCLDARRVAQKSSPEPTGLFHSHHNTRTSCCLPLVVHPG